ncbi:MAG TPA: alpha/beta hydrolase domain-containing protein [Polyangiales bacterium]|nr:alpha/beta hydrolase domain-containing protein [Polyangiales bacterium]
MITLKAQSSDRKTAVRDRACIFSQAANHLSLSGKPRTYAVCATLLVSLLHAVSACASDDDDAVDTPIKTSGSTAGAKGAAGSRAQGTAAVPETLKTTGPVSGGKDKPFTATISDLASADYTEKEFFFEGSASAYKVQGSMSMDGKWTLAPTTSAAFKSRLLVRRPVDEHKFNGTVIVEWLNVSGGVDADPGFVYNSDEILRFGYAWVGVSAQIVGVEGGGFAISSSPDAVALKVGDPERYASLRHPGDAYSYDIFSKAAEVIRTPAGIDVLEGLEPKRLIGYGESQSAGRMVSYVNGVHPLVERYDGFFIHSRGGSGAPFEDSTLPSIGFGGSPTTIRDDIAAKVFQFQTETDVVGMLAFLPARQPDSDGIRTWEVTGTTHADKFLSDYAKVASGGTIDQCPGANDGPHYQTIRAALRSLHVWLSDGTEPPKAETMETDASGKLLKDEYDNGRGGVRSPDLDVPIRTLSADPAPMSDFICFLFGSTTPFTPERLRKLYPSHEDYVRKVTESAQRLQDAGFLLEPEAKGFIEAAEKAPVPK